MRIGKHQDTRQGINVKHKLDSLLLYKPYKFGWLFVYERKQIAVIADANLAFAPHPCKKSLRNEDKYRKCLKQKIP